MGMEWKEEKKEEEEREEFVVVDTIDLGIAMRERCLESFQVSLSYLLY